MGSSLYNQVLERAAGTLTRQGVTGVSAENVEALTLLSESPALGTFNRSLLMRGLFFEEYLEYTSLKRQVSLDGYLEDLERVSEEAFEEFEGVAEAFEEFEGVAEEASEEAFEEEGFEEEFEEDTWRGSIEDFPKTTPHPTPATSLPKTVVPSIDYSGTEDVWGSLDSEESPNPTQEGTPLPDDIGFGSVWDFSDDEEEDIWATSEEDIEEEEEEELEDTWMEDEGEDDTWSNVEEDEEEDWEEDTWGSVVETKIDANDPRYRIADFIKTLPGTSVWDSTSETVVSEPITGSFWASTPSKPAPKEALPKEEVPFWQQSAAPSAKPKEEPPFWEQGTPNSTTEASGESTHRVVSSTASANPTSAPKTEPSIKALRDKTSRDRYSLLLGLTSSVRKRGS